MIAWKEDYVLGIEEIDKQHKELFRIATEVHGLIRNELIFDKYDKILKLLAELKEYTIFHFTSEEEYMLSIGYRKLLSHKVEHNDFIEKINNVDLDKIDQDHESYLMEILEFVLGWISNHILKTDKAYAE